MKNPVRVISLTRSVTRREAFNQLNKHINFEYFDAIDGLEITKQMIVESQLFQDALPYTTGSYGAALSHLNLWERAIKENRVVTIAEDDAVFRFDFEEQYCRLINNLPPDWDIILWGWNFDFILSLNILPGVSPVVAAFNQNQLRVSVDNFQNLNVNTCAFRLDKCLGTPAYSISPIGAAKFKSHCFPVINFKLYFPLHNRWLPNTSLDYAMNRIYNSTNSYCCLPPLAITKNEHSISTIQGGSLLTD